MSKKENCGKKGSLSHGGFRGKGWRDLTVGYLSHRGLWSHVAFTLSPSQGPNFGIMPFFSVSPIPFPRAPDKYEVNGKESVGQRTQRLGL